MASRDAAATAGGGGGGGGSPVGAGSHARAADRGTGATVGKDHHVNVAAGGSPTERRTESLLGNSRTEGAVCSGTGAEQNAILFGAAVGFSRGLPLLISGSRVCNGWFRRVN